VEIALARTGLQAAYGAQSPDCDIAVGWINLDAIAFAEGRQPSNSLVARSDHVFQRLKEFCRIHSYRLANGQKFHDIDAAFTALIFGHKRLRPMKAISQFALS
jgi:hypothetical protein